MVWVDTQSLLTHLVNLHCLVNTVPEHFSNETICVLPVCPKHCLLLFIPFGKVDDRDIISANLLYWPLPDPAITVPNDFGFDVPEPIGQHRIIEHFLERIVQNVGRIANGDGHGWIRFTSACASEYV